MLRNLAAGRTVAQREVSRASTSFCMPGLDSRRRSTSCSSGSQLRARRLARQTCRSDARAGRAATHAPREERRHDTGLHETRARLPLSAEKVAQPQCFHWCARSMRPADARPHCTAS
eukprot:6161248-Prymnesium_polylepis.1